MRLTVYDDGHSRVGVFEEDLGGLPAVARHAFGAGLRDIEILELVRGRLPALSAAHDAASGVHTAAAAARPTNPKRWVRESAKALAQHGVSTRAQEALKLVVEARRHAGRVSRREEREEALVRRRAAAAQKAQKKHRGH